MFSRILQVALIGMLLIGGFLGSAPPADAMNVHLPSESMHLAALPGVGSLFSGKRPPNLGVKDGKLSPCPNSPNCVVSQGASDAEHAIAPLTYQTDRATAMAHLKSVIESQPRTRIISQTEDYLYAEFESKLMGFVDDVEFYFDPAESVIQVRSASRLGESDLGVNRQRIESLRSGLAQMEATG